VTPVQAGAQEALQRRLVEPGKSPPQAVLEQRAGGGSQLERLAQRC
jgi:hypothetical protein